MIPLSWVTDPFSKQTIHFQDTLQCAHCASHFIRKPCHDEDDLQNIVKCRQGCGAIYCSELCRSSHFTNHRTLCVGPLDEAHPIYQYKVFSLEAGLPDNYISLTLALELLAVHRDKWRNIYSKIQSESRNWEGDDDEDDGVDAISNSYQFIKDIFADNQPVLYAEWQQVLKYANSKRVEISVQSPWSKFCKELTATDSLTSNHFIIQEARRQWHRNNVEDGSDSGEEIDAMVIDATILMDEAEVFFPPTSIWVLLDEADIKWEHSCLPSHKLVMKSSRPARNLELCCVSVTSNRETEGTIGDYVKQGLTCICLVNDELDFEDRKEELRLRGVASCSCARCRYEQQNLQQDGLTSTTAIGLFSFSTLTCLLDLAKKQQRHEDAMVLCNQMLQLSADPSVLLQRTQIAGWMGHFSKREKLLEEAAGLVTTDVKIQDALEEARAYYREPWADNRVQSLTNTELSTSSTIPGLEEQAFVIEGFLDAEECARMVNLAEDYQHQLGGWTTSRHYAVPTTDVAIYQMPIILDWFNLQLEEKIFPLLRHQFKDFAPSTEGEYRLRIFDAFLVKYDANTGQKRLPLHNDQSVYSLTIAMNACNEYEGGGTYFAETGQSYKTDVGGIVSFEGELLHAGRNITNGVRYIIACFLYVEEKES